MHDADNFQVEFRFQCLYLDYINSKRSSANVLTVWWEVG
jgi:hypothetical protein